MHTDVCRDHQVTLNFQIMTLLNRIYKPITSFFRKPECLYWWVVIALIIPNILLDVTETSPILCKISNVLLPVGVYMLLMAACRKIGIMSLLMLPFMILAAFQLVLLYLYGESVIAVDMFLNVVTTNVREVNELLGNLIYAIGAVVVLYLPPLIWGGIAVAKKSIINEHFRRKVIRVGGLSAICGCVAAAGSLAVTPQPALQHEIFPVNAVNNMIEAIRRAKETNNFMQTSADYTFDARSLRDSSLREVYVLVVGETSRALNWQLNGYGRETNPLLSQEPNVTFFGKSISESNTTHKSVPMLMSALSAENFNEINGSKSIITAMKEAGFHTHYFSNQAPNRSYIEFFGAEADDVRYTQLAAVEHPFDHEMVKWVKKELQDNRHAKEFFVLHTYGSHFLYRDRYPSGFDYFLPDNAVDANAANRASLINGYDNSIRYTDCVLADLISVLKEVGCYSGLLYSSDHGEDIFDDSRNRFLHASPSPTYYQLHVASLAWVSDSLAADYPTIQRNIRQNSVQPVSPQRSLFHTAMQMAGVATPVFEASYSLAGSTYTAGNPVYLTDHNTSVPLVQSGVKEADIMQLNRLLKR